MSDKPVNKSRRGAIKAMMGGLAAAPLMSLVGMAAAQAAVQAETAIPADAVDEKDPIAAQLKYKHDARDSERDKITPVEGAMPAAKRFCSNCMFQQPIIEDEWVRCQIFPTKFVNIDGWCTSWMPRPSA